MSESSKLLTMSEAFTRLQSCRVLVVGAGGIGCELLKNLVLCHVGYIEVVDLDTIDVSNLNRQFLFRKEHVGLSKAVVAREKVLQFNPKVEIKAHHANIMDKCFSVKWFQSFDLVMNALDNVAARRYVNMMCLATERPLVESGTAGYLGQAVPIIPNSTECFDCLPKPAPKTFPVCTIRNTPSQPIHCIVWGKFVFTELFGRCEQALRAEEAIEETSLEKLRNCRSESQFAEKLINQLFVEEINRLASMEEVWEGKRPPTAVKPTMNLASLALPARGNELIVWSKDECMAVLNESVSKLSVVDVDQEFDKDDDDMLDFVAALANLRAEAFGIEKISRFKIKEMAGNIIPAIATTNAMIAGAVVLLGISLVSDTRVEDLKNVYLARMAKGRRQLLQTERAMPPSLKCATCTSLYFILHVNTVSFRLGDILTKVVKGSLASGGLGLESFEEITILEKERVLYDLDFDDLLNNSLKDLDVGVLRVIVENEKEEQGTLILFIVDEESQYSGFFIEGSSKLPIDSKKFFLRKQLSEAGATQKSKAKVEGSHLVITSDSESEDDMIILGNDGDRSNSNRMNYTPKDEEASREKRALELVEVKDDKKRKKLYN